MVSKVRRPEEALQRSFVAQLRARALPGVVFWATPNGGFRTKAEAGIMKALGQRAGIPDMFVAIPNVDVGCSNIVGIEFKAKHGRVSDAQASTFDALESCGITVLYCAPKDFDSVLDTLVMLRAIRADANAKS